MVIRPTISARGYPVGLGSSFPNLCYAVVAVPRFTPDIVFTSVIMQATGNHSSLSHYFGTDCHLENGCIDQLIITMPFYVSVFYSLGALLARIYPGTTNLSGAGYKGELTRRLECIRPLHS
jgi:hypothetical protein